MALEAGEIRFTLQFAKDLKDQDWFGKQDPYCVVECGAQKIRSRTHVDGGRNPVWNETMKFQIVNDNEIVVTIWDADVGGDDLIGTARVPLATARERPLEEKHLTMNVTAKKGKQRGLLSVVLHFTPNSSLKPQSQPAAHAQPVGAVYYPATQPYSQPCYPYPHPAPYYPGPQPVPALYSAPPAMMPTHYAAQPPAAYYPPPYQPMPAPYR